jgi:hypothetical protein
MGRAKKRAKETMDAESLSDGSPAATIRELMERGTAVEDVATGFAAADEGIAFGCEPFRTGDSGLLVVLPDIFCMCILTTLSHFDNTLMP